MRNHFFKPDSFVERKEAAPRIKDTEKDWKAPEGAPGTAMEEVEPLSEFTPALSLKDVTAEGISGNPDSYVQQQDAFRITDTGVEPDPKSSRLPIAETPRIQHTIEESDEVTTQRSPVGSGDVVPPKAAKSSEGTSQDASSHAPAESKMPFEDDAPATQRSPHLGDQAA